MGGGGVEKWIFHILLYEHWPSFSPSLFFSKPQQVCVCVLGTSVSDLGDKDMTKSLSFPTLNLWLFIKNDKID